MCRCALTRANIPDQHCGGKQQTKLRKGAETEKKEYKIRKKRPQGNNTFYLTSSNELPAGAERGPAEQPYLTSGDGRPRGSQHTEHKNGYPAMMSVDPPVKCMVRLFGAFNSELKLCDDSFVYRSILSVPRFD